MIRNALLVLGSLLACLGLLELGLRVAGYNPLGDLLYGERVSFIRPAAMPERIYEGVPLAHGRAWGAEVQLNSLGLRDREYALPKPPGTQRIVVIGDSVTVGNYMPQEDTYAEQLEQRYAGEGRAIEVINLGLGGYDTLQEVATLEDIGLRLEPDLVVLGYCINDIGVASGNLDYILKLQEYGATPLYRLRLAQLVRVQLDRIRLGQELIAANKAERFAATYGQYSEDVTQDATLMALREQLGQTDGSDRRFIFSNLYGTPANLGRLRYAFSRLQAVAAREGFPVLVVVIPFLVDEPANQATWQTVYRMVAHEAGRAGFEVFDAYGVFREYGFERLPQRRNDPIHPNAAGHRLLADGIAERIARHGWLAAPATP